MVIFYYSFVYDSMWELFRRHFAIADFSSNLVNCLWVWESFVISSRTGAVVLSSFLWIQPELLMAELFLRELGIKWFSW